MSFDWSSFLTMADALAGLDDEASHQVAVSRAYYACFNQIRVAL